MGPLGDDRTQRTVGESKSEEWEIPVGNLDEHVGGAVDFVGGDIIAGGE